MSVRLVGKGSKFAASLASKVAEVQTKESDAVVRAKQAAAQVLAAGSSTAAKIGLGAKAKPASKSEKLAGKISKKLEKSANKKKRLAADQVDDDETHDGADSSLRKDSTRHVPGKNPLDSFLADKGSKKKRKKRKVVKNQAVADDKSDTPAAKESEEKASPTEPKKSKASSKDPDTKVISKVSKHRADSESWKRVQTNAGAGPVNEDITGISEADFASNWTDDALAPWEEPKVVEKAQTESNKPKQAKSEKRKQVEAEPNKPVEQGTSKPEKHENLALKVENGRLTVDRAIKIMDPNILKPASDILLSRVKRKEISVAEALRIVGQSASSPVKRQKKKKKRSKQKNLKKDTRPEHLKPTYMSPGAVDYRTPKPKWAKKSNRAKGDTN